MQMVGGHFKCLKPWFRTANIGQEQESAKKASLSTGNVSCQRQVCRKRKAATVSGAGCLLSSHRHTVFCSLTAKCSILFGYYCIWTSDCFFLHSEVLFQSAIPIPFPLPSSCQSIRCCVSASLFRTLPTMLVTSAHSSKQDTSC